MVAVRLACSPPTMAIRVQSPDRLEVWVNQALHVAPQEVVYRSRFGQQWIGRGGPITWPARSPDLTPLDYFVWGHVEGMIYDTPVESRRTCWRGLWLRRILDIQRDSYLYWPLLYAGGLDEGLANGNYCRRRNGVCSDEHEQVTSSLSEKSKDFCGGSFVASRIKFVPVSKPICMHPPLSNTKQYLHTPGSEGDNAESEMEKRRFFDTKPR
ncbi:hypothetical protein PR048_032628 [Dryococelus australis]|uniref:Uncharacterized protein n=1 Tax=Dryococelus australis TaxID=614101 RepID=A0ABQ9G2R0_9NEOP|nr:hypothetical protein PR048_032628 [Dryococelus australis]